MKNSKISRWEEREKQRGRGREEEREAIGEFLEEFIHGNKNFSIKTGICIFHLNALCTKLKDFAIFRSYHQNT